MASLVLQDALAGAQGSRRCCRRSSRSSGFSGAVALGQRDLHRHSAIRVTGLEDGAEDLDTADVCCQARVGIALALPSGWAKGVKLRSALHLFCCLVGSVRCNTSCELVCFWLDAVLLIPCYLVTCNKACCCKAF